VIALLYERGQLTELREAIKKLDPDLVHSLEYLKATINFMIRMNMDDELYHFHV
jgi:hypothetical protein